MKLKKKTYLPNLILTSLLAALILLAPSIAYSQEKQTTGENTGLPLPRFAALKSNNINARSGPGDNYPVKAVYKRAGLPVEIVSEFKLWREQNGFKRDDLITFTRRFCRKTRRNKLK